MWIALACRILKRKRSDTLLQASLSIFSLHYSICDQQLQTHNQQTFPFIPFFPLFYQEVPLISKSLEQVRSGSHNIKMQHIQ